MIKHRKRRAVGRRRQRLGVEIVELAFALPVMVVIVFGVLETCQLIFIKQSLAVAAYEAGRVVAREEGTKAEAIARFNQIVSSRGTVDGGMKEVTITFTPDDVENVPKGDQIRVDVSAPVGVNTTTNLVLKGLPDMTEAVVFLRE